MPQAIDMEAFIGRWKVTETENIAEIMKVMGMAEDTQKVLLESLPEIEYGKDGDMWIMIITAPQGRKEYKFTAGQELETTSIDGRNVKSKIDIDNNKFVETYFYEEHQTIVTREIQGNELIATLNCKGITSTARHKKIN